ncbi:MAG: protein kinase domain-containing protein [Prosthecobacter sp.]|uniref:protein kinase domain-containing protein n=1 Tax=Prosthecobacter sp. TaxID=1965333 RepID=UPI0039028F29
MSPETPSHLPAEEHSVCDHCGAPVEAGGACTACVMEMALIGVQAFEQRHEDVTVVLPDPPRGLERVEEWTLPRHLGGYDLLRIKGSGGMGVVFEGHDAVLDRRVAVKLLRTVAAGREVYDRFLKEMRAIASLKHPHIVSIYRGEEEDGMPFFGMEYVDGDDLGLHVLEHGAMPVVEALRVLIAAGEALAAAHEIGVIHRDVKPTNVLRSAQGEVKVVDFGVSLIAGAESGSDDGLFGTLGFMAPEQAADPASVDTRADIYGLGATAFFLLSGTIPLHEFAGREAKLQALREGKGERSLKKVSAVPAAVAALVERMMAPRPTDRPASMAVAVQELKACLDRASGAHFRRWLRRGMAIGCIAVVSCVAAVLLPALVRLLPIQQQALDISGAQPMTNPMFDKATMGYLFELDEPVEISELGWFDHGSNGLDKPVNIAIWHAADRETVLKGVVGTERARAVTSAETSGRWLFEPLAAPVRLEPGTYVIGGSVWSAQKDPVMMQAEVEDRLPGFKRRQNMTTDHRFHSSYGPGNLHMPDSTALSSQAGGVTKRWFGPNFVAKRLFSAADGPAQTLVFDGFDDYVQVPSLRYAGELPYTLEATVHLAKNLTKQQSTILAVGAPITIKLSLHHEQWELRRGKDGVSGDSAFFEAKKADLGRWLHVAAVWTTADAPPLLFVDGQARPLARMEPFRYGGIRSSEVPSGIGAHFHPNNRQIGEDRLRGHLAEVRISKVARYHEVFTPPAKGDRLPLDEHTEALYHFEPVDGDDSHQLQDMSPNNHHGTIMEARWAPFR